MNARAQNRKQAEHEMRARDRVWCRVLYLPIRPSKSVFIVERQLLITQHFNTSGSFLQVIGDTLRFERVQYRAVPFSQGKNQYSTSNGHEIRIKLMQESTNLLVFLMLWVVLTAHYIYPVWSKI